MNCANHRAFTARYQRNFVAIPFLISEIPLLKLVVLVTIELAHRKPVHLVHQSDSRQAFAIGKIHSRKDLDQL